VTSATRAARAGARTPLPWLGALLLLYLGVPVVAFLVRLAATHDRGFHDAGLFPALGTSALAATIATALIAVLGVPLAYVLARSRGRLATACGIAVQLPLALPPVMGGILLVYLVGPYTALGRLFGGALTDSFTGIVLAQTFVAAPFLVVTARAAFGAVDPALEDVAATLGHGGVARFLRVAVPVAAPGIRAGMVLAWLRAFGEYGATVILAYHPTSLPVYTFTQFSSTGLPGTMAPTALALAVAAGCVALGRVLLVPVLRARRHRRRGVRSRSALEVRRRLGPRAETNVAPSARPASAGPVQAVSFALDLSLGRRDIGRAQSLSAVDGRERRSGFRLSVSHRGETARLAVLGPSGSGKSTLLRCLAGLLGPEAGHVQFGERAVASVPSGRRRVGYVAQGFGLFPHLRVRDQLLFGRDADPAVADHWLHRMHLGGLEDRFPSELSGGQRQRVALAQALARAPDVLLLDEPFAALDTPVRRDLQRDLRRLQRETGVSTVVVTHDPEEAALLADEVLVIDDGRALQQGRVRAVFAAPRSWEVARLVGVPNAHRASVLGPGVVAVGPTRLPANTGELSRGTPVVWSVRPEEVLVSPTTRQSGESWTPPGLVGQVEDVADLGVALLVSVRLGPDVVVEARRRGDEPVDLVPGQWCVANIIDASVWPSEATTAPSTADVAERPDTDGPVARDAVTDEPRFSSVVGPRR